MSTRYTRGLRVRTKCRTVDELVGWFHRFCDETSIFIATPTPRSEGIDTVFSIDLANGESALVGEGVVLRTFTTRSNRFGQPGMQVGVRRMTRTSVHVFEQLLIARAVAQDSARSNTPDELAQEWDEGTEVGAPSFHDAANAGVAQPAASTDAANPAAASARPSDAAVADHVRRVETAPITKQTLIGLPSLPVPGVDGNASRSTSARIEIPPVRPVATPAAPARLSPTAFAIAVPTRIPKRVPESASAALQIPPAKAAPPVRVTSARDRSASAASPAEPAVVTTAEPAARPEPPIAVNAEIGSARVPRAATVLGSGPVPRMPADTPVEEAHAADTPVEEAHAADTLVEEARAADPPVEEAHATEVPVDAAPALEVPATPATDAIDSPRPHVLVDAAPALEVPATPVVDAVDSTPPVVLPAPSAAALAAPESLAAPPTAAQLVASPVVATEVEPERSTLPLLAWSTDQRSPARRARISIAIGVAALVCLAVGAAVLWSGTDTGAHPVANSAAPAATDPPEATSSDEPVAPSTASAAEADESAPAVADDPVVAPEPSPAETPAPIEPAVTAETTPAVDESTEVADSLEAASVEQAGPEPTPVKRASTKRAAGKRVATGTRGKTKHATASKRHASKPARHKAGRRKAKRSGCSGLDCL